jgi:aspartate kinase
MRVFKFGGASVKDAEGIINLGNIVAAEGSGLVIVVSALGKTTNALESMLRLWIAGKEEYRKQLADITDFHSSVADDLKLDATSCYEVLQASFRQLEALLILTKPSSFDFDYDQIVSYGELWSTIIVSGHLAARGVDSEWIDIRQNLITDHSYRDANIHWESSSRKILDCFGAQGTKKYVTQGFIGGTENGDTTTLGREGSDYSAAIIANILDAESVTVWKDVPGLLNADPKWLPDAEKMDEVSYREAVEMTFSGAKVIHPKTIKPLQNKQIPLFVKSFLAPGLPGTKVTATPDLKKVMPVYIRKENQVLLTLLPRDFSFVMGDNLSRVFNIFLQHKIKVNLVEASAVSIDVCVDDDRPLLDTLLADLKNEYSALYNEGLEILTVRHYTPDSAKKISKGRDILLEQRTRSTVRFVVRKIDAEADYLSNSSLSPR